MEYEKSAVSSFGGAPDAAAVTPDPDPDPEGGSPARSRGPAPSWDGGPADRFGPAREALDRGRELVERPTVRVVGGALVLVCVAIWWFVAGGASARTSAPSGPFTAGGTTIPLATSSADHGDNRPTAGSSSPDNDPTAEELVVHAAGAVVAPGVYRLRAGARVGDLVTAAGGLAADADGDRLNLAEPLGDGVRVYVPHLGEAEVPSIQDVDTPPGAAAPPGGGGGSSGGAPAGPVDINDATLDQLDQLPGVGPATAQAIVDHREQNGPFASVDELLEVRGIGPAKLEQLRPLVTV